MLETPDQAAAFSTVPVLLHFTLYRFFLSRKALFLATYSSRRVYSAAKTRYDPYKIWLAAWLGIISSPCRAAKFLCSHPAKRLALRALPSPRERLLEMLLLWTKHH